MSDPVARRHLRQALGGPVLSLATAFLVMGVAELALRVVGYAPERYRNTARVVAPRWRGLLDCYPTNPRGYFDLDLRDAAVRERFRWMAPLRIDAVAARAPWAVEFRYNALRFRDVEPAAKPVGVRRVAIVGDSFTEGQGVREPDTYPRVLEGLLNASGAGGSGGASSAPPDSRAAPDSLRRRERWEVRNCARRATDFPDINDAFEGALSLSPDVVVYAMVLNDAFRSPDFQARQSYVNDWILDRARVLESGTRPEPRPTDLRMSLLVRDRLESWRIGRETERWYREMYGPANREGWARTQESIREMNRRTRDRGARFLVASWPLLVRLDRYPFADVHETIGRFCVQAGIPRHDLRKALVGRKTESLWVHPVDRHPNEVAHRLAAESLRDAILSLP